tara:strand:- start:65 stop:178 length:114 start_codon:yes stop_codon:yes gene_type:complete
MLLAMVEQILAVGQGEQRGITQHIQHRLEVLQEVLVV